MRRRSNMQGRKPERQYRTEPADDHSPMAYVTGGGPASYMTEAMYRAKGFEPPFDDLPTEAEYDA